MTIGIDISQIAYEGTGVARYTKMLVESVLKNDDKNDYVFFFSSLRRNLPADIEKNIRGKHRLIKTKLPPSALNVLWNKLHIFPVNRLIGQCDVFISSDWTQPPVSKHTKSATVVHDLVYLRYPETLPKQIIDVQTRRMLWVKKEVDVIIADSKSTKQDLIELIEIPEKKIHVVYPAVEVKEPTENDIKHINTKYSILSTKYILSVGKLEPRKNIPRLISAFQKANLKDIQLLIVGPEGWQVQDSPGVTDLSVEASAKAELAPRGWRDQTNVRFLGFVPDSDLYALYSQSLFFIYPSLYEGFGYPVVEAMSLGCPVATSNTSSLKEIAEGCGLLFDPNSEEELTNVIKKLYGDENLRDELRRKGRKKTTYFSFRTFAEQFISALK